jgi:serine/threonine-protein kinase
MSSTEVDPFIGRVIENRFEIVSLLGRGGMALVYKAQHKQVDLTVAIKILHYSFSSSAINIERFKREAKTVNSLFHPNIITMYSCGILESGEPYLVFDCLPGQSLAERLQSSGRLEADKGVAIFLQVCQGLGYAHEHGVLHRDLKPANIMLVQGEDGAEVVKILDFGIAKILPNSGQEAQQLTQVGEVFGSPLYMSPEQCQGDELDHRSDIYAMGCLMYEALAGQLPLLGKNVLATMAKHVSEMPPRFENVGVEVPPRLEQIVFKALQKKPDERFQSMKELEEALLHQLA